MSVCLFCVCVFLCVASDSEKTAKLHKGCRAIDRYISQKNAEY
jgi:hypothetical protein